MQTYRLLLNKLAGFGPFSLMAKAPTLPPPASSMEQPHHGVLVRLNQCLWTQRQREGEAREAKATDADEVEARVQDVGRTVPHPYY